MSLECFQMICHPKAMRMNLNYRGGNKYEKNHMMFLQLQKEHILLLDHPFQ